MSTIEKKKPVDGPARRSSFSPLVLHFAGAGFAPVAVPVDRRVGFDFAGSLDEAVICQDAWQCHHVGRAPERRGLTFGVTFVFPDEPGASGIYDRNFTCRAMYGMLHYIMHLYNWPKAVKDRFPAGLVRFHELVVLDHNCVRVTPAHYDAILLNSTRLALAPRSRVPINFTILCYRHAMRTSDVTLTLRQFSRGVERAARCSLVTIEHQTFSQLLFAIHQQVDRVASFYSGEDRVRITESLMDGTDHELTQDSYGTRLHDPDARLLVEFTQTAP